MWYILKGRDSFTLQYEMRVKEFTYWRLISTKSSAIADKTSIVLRLDPPLGAVVDKQVVSSLHASGR